jgi:hypothetical protein
VLWRGQCVSKRIAEGHRPDRLECPGGAGIARRMVGGQEANEMGVPGRCTL